MFDKATQQHATSPDRALNAAHTGNRTHRAASFLTRQSNCRTRTGNRTHTAPCMPARQSDCHAQVIETAQQHAATKGNSTCQAGNTTHSSSMQPQVSNSNCHAHTETHNSTRHPHQVVAQIVAQCKVALGSLERKGSPLSQHHTSFSYYACDNATARCSTQQTAPVSCALQSFV